MGALLDTTAALDARFHMPTYARRPIMFVRGEGMRLFDDDGREYLDFASGIGVVNLGHAHRAVASAVCAQMQRLVHVSNLYHVEHRDVLAERLVALFGGGAKVFFANSGAEANEGAIKLARRWGKTRGGEACTRIISAERSFHGRTLATLAATGQPSKQEAFEPLPAGFTHVPLNDIDALFAEMDETVCAVLLEPIQGEGGVFPCDLAYLAAVRTLCDERGVLLILDEVQTGFFRTGTAFAWQGYGARPDIMTLAKGMANGLPIGAVVALDSVAEAFRPGDHGSTFGGGPVVCAAALATIDALESESLGENAIRVGSYLREQLSTLAAITDVRGRGLMMGITLAEPVAPAVAATALNQGCVVLSVGDSMLRFLPPLVCSNAEVDTLLETLSAALGST